MGRLLLRPFRDTSSLPQTEQTDDSPVCANYAQAVDLETPVCANCASQASMAGPVGSKSKSGRIVSALSRLLQRKPTPETDSRRTAVSPADAAASAFIARVVSETALQQSDGENIRRHVTSLPASYVAAGYSASAVRCHMAMLDEAASLRDGIPVIRLDVKNSSDSTNTNSLSAGSDDSRHAAATAAVAHCACDSDDDDDDSSVAALSLSSVDESLSVSRTEVTFACNAPVCARDLAAALQRATGMKAHGLITYDVASTGATLGHFALRASISQFSTRDIEDVFAGLHVVSGIDTNNKRSSPRASFSAPRVVVGGKLPEAFSNIVGRMSPMVSPMHHLYSNGHAHRVFGGNHHQHSNSFHNTGSLRRSQQPATGLAGSASSRAPVAASPLGTSPDGKGLLHVLLSERGSMKKRLGALILDPMALDVGPVMAVGASGEVRRGTYAGEDVAVKVLRGEGRDAQALVAEFRREVGALMACGECAQLLKFLGVCVDVRGRMCIVTKFMEGGSLNDYLRARKLLLRGDSATASTSAGPLPLAEVLSIARDVAVGMAFLHAHGMVHRDLKSANILLDRAPTSAAGGGAGCSPRAVVGDFGVARLKGERGEMTKEVGTYRWMAPEAFGTSSWPVTHKADVYSFGIVLWELVAGEVPFADHTPLQAAVAVALNGARPQVPEGCPEGLRRLMERCWDKAPKARPEFSEVVAVLDAMVAEEGRRSGGQ